MACNLSLGSPSRVSKSLLSVESIVRSSPDARERSGSAPLHDAARPSSGRSPYTASTPLSGGADSVRESSASGGAAVKASDAASGGAQRPPHVESSERTPYRTTADSVTPSPQLPSPRAKGLSPIWRSSDKCTRGVRGAEGAGTGVLFGINPTAELEREASALRLKLRHMEEQLVIAEAKLDLANESKRLAEVRVVGLQREQTHLEVSMRSLNAQLESLQNENKELTAKLAASEEQLRASQPQAAAKEAAVESERLRMELAALQQQLLEGHAGRMGLAAALRRALRAVERGGANSEPPSPSPSLARSNAGCTERCVSDLNPGRDAGGAPVEGNEFAGCNAHSSKHVPSFAALQMMVTQIAEAYLDLQSRTASDHRRSRSPSVPRSVCESGHRHPPAAGSQPVLPPQGGSDAADVAGAELDDSAQTDLVSTNKKMRLELDEANATIKRLRNNLEHRAVDLQDKAEELERLLNSAQKPAAELVKRPHREVPLSGSAHAGPVECAASSPRHDLRKDAAAVDFTPYAEQFHLQLSYDGEALDEVPWGESDVKLLKLVFESEAAKACSPCAVRLRSAQRMHHGTEMVLRYDIHATPTATPAEVNTKLTADGVANTHYLFNALCDLHATEQALCHGRARPSDAPRRARQSARGDARRDASSATASSIGSSSPSDDGRSPSSHRGDCDSDWEHVHRMLASLWADETGGNRGRLPPLKKLELLVDRWRSDDQIEEEEEEIDQLREQLEDEIARSRTLIRASRKLKDDCNKLKQQLVDILEDDAGTSRVGESDGNGADGDAHAAFDAAKKHWVTSTSSSAPSHGGDSRSTSVGEAAASPGTDHLHLSGGASISKGSNNPVESTDPSSSGRSCSDEVIERLLYQWRLRRCERKAREALPVDVVALQSQLQKASMENEFAKSELAYEKQISARSQGELAALRSQLEGEVERRRELQHAFEEALAVADCYENAMNATEDEFPEPVDCAENESPFGAARAVSRGELEDGAIEVQGVAELRRMRKENLIVHLRITQGALSRMKTRYEDQSHALDDYRNAMRSLRGELFGSKNAVQSMKRQLYMVQASYAHEKRLTKQLREQGATMEQLLNRYKEAPSGGTGSEATRCGGAVDSAGAERRAAPCNCDSLQAQVVELQTRELSSASEKQTLAKDLEAARVELDAALPVVRSATRVFEGLMGLKPRDGNERGGRESSQEPHSASLRSSPARAKSVPRDAAHPDNMPSRFNRCVMHLKSLLPSMEVFLSRHHEGVEALRMCHDALVEIAITLAEMHGKRPSGVEDASELLTPESAATTAEVAQGAVLELLSRRAGDPSEGPPTSRTLTYCENPSPSQAPVAVMESTDSLVSSISRETCQALRCCRSLKTFYYYQHEKIQAQLARIEALADAHRATTEELEEALVQLESINSADSVSADLKQLHAMREDAINAMIAAKESLGDAIQSSAQILSRLLRGFHDEDPGSSEKFHEGVVTANEGGSPNEEVLQALRAHHVVLFDTHRNLIEELRGVLTESERREVLLVKGDTFFIPESANTHVEYSDEAFNYSDHSDSEQRLQAEAFGPASVDFYRGPTPRDGECRSPCKVKNSTAPEPYSRDAHAFVRTAGSSPEAREVDLALGESGRARGAAPSVSPEESCCTAPAAAALHVQAREGLTQQPALGEDEKRLLREALKRARRHHPVT